MELEWDKILGKIGRVLIAAALGLSGLFIWQWGRVYDGKLHLVFCDVGQGDAILIRENTLEVLIDGGPDKNVLSCLSENMPFWDREIEVVVLTHPEADHLSGLIPVIERYRVGYFISSPVGNSSAGFAKLQDLIEEKGVPVKNLYSGGTVSFDGLKLISLWPEKSWLMAKLESSRTGLVDKARPFSEGKAVLGIETTTNLNDFSLVFHLKYGRFDALLTGDADERVQDEIMETAQIEPVEIFKVPHHGSKTGMIDEFLERASPDLAVISVGKNRWGHPTEEILEKLRNFDPPAGEAGIKILRTDQEGEIEIVTDGETWEVR